MENVYEVIASQPRPRTTVRHPETANLNLDLDILTSAQPVVVVVNSAVRFSYQEMLRVKGA